MERKRMKSSKKLESFTLEEEEDRISALPDCLIHHILSFLPSTKEAIKTGVLSKRWKHQWNHVPNLIFEYDWCNPDDIGKFSKFIDGALILNCCSKLNKFVISGEINYFDEILPQLSWWLLYATRKEVKKLCLNVRDVMSEDRYFLPFFLYNNTSLIQLTIECCHLVSSVSINWSSLKVLEIRIVEFDNDVVENILNGSPLLESLKFSTCYGSNKFHITSKHLKSLVLADVCEVDGSGVLEISAPYLQRLEIYGLLRFEGCKLMNLRSLNCAILGFWAILEEVESVDFLVEILQELQHVEELELGRWCLQTLSTMGCKGLSSSLSNSKCLIVGLSSFAYDLPRIASLINTLPGLEKLIINLCNYNVAYMERQASLVGQKLKRLVEKCWESFKTASISMSCLKTVEIVGLNASFGDYEFGLKFVEYLQQHAKGLEKMVIYKGNNESKGNRMEIVNGMSQKLPRSSRSAVIISPRFARHELQV